MRLAKHAWKPGDPLPEVGWTVTMAGSNSDISSDQDRKYSEVKVIGYTPDGIFACFQRGDCWPFVERLTNCWFAPADLDWAPLAKALFQVEHDPKIKDQAWFDFQGKAQRLIALMQTP